MLLGALNRMLKQILSQDLNSNGKVEGTCACKRKTTGTQSKNPTGGTKISIGSMVSGGNEKKVLPDP